MSGPFCLGLFYGVIVFGVREMGNGQWYGWVDYSIGRRGYARSLKASVKN